jgi:large subunit ribosomal protein L10
MPAAKKIQQVQDLQDLLEGSSIVIGTNYAGLTVADLDGLRKVLRENGCKYKVVKNRLAVRAGDGVGKARLGEILQGPVGLVVTKGDPAPAARALTTYIRSTRLNLPVTGAVINGRVLTAADLEMLANLPSREVLLAQVLGSMQAVTQNLVSVLYAHLSSIVNVLEQRRKQLEERS